jgi:hypothetical protein
LQIRKRKWGWLGHTLPKSPDDIARQALRVEPPKQTGQGKTEEWRRTMLEEVKGVKMTLAEIKTDITNRLRWRIVVEALCTAAE